jgi:hypothetical protein
MYALGSECVHMRVYTCVCTLGTYVYVCLGVDDVMCVMCFTWAIGHEWTYMCTRAQIHVWVTYVLHVGMYALGSYAHLGTGLRLGSCTCEIGVLDCRRGSNRVKYGAVRVDAISLFSLIF